MHIRRILLCAAALVLLAPVVHAEWAEWGFVPDPLPGYQYLPAAASDGEGGMIYVWMDDGGGSTFHLYAQRIDGWGNRLWNELGIPICAPPGREQSYPAVASDGMGGAYIVWKDTTLPVDPVLIYAQHIDGAGNVSYNPGGVPISAWTGAGPENPSIAEGEEGSAYVAWSQVNAGLHEVHVMRLDPNGPSWSTGGVILRAVADPLGQTRPVAIRSGAAVVWVEYDSVTGADIMAQSVRPDGSSWWGTAQPVCAEPGTQNYPEAMPDGQGGIFVVWQDHRGSSDDIYVNRIDDDSSHWSFGGVPVCDAAGYQQYPRIAPSGDGAYVVWEDYRTSSELYYQKVTWQLDMLLADDGVVLCNATNRQWLQAAMSDGGDGLIVLWEDERYDNYFDLFAQRIDGQGHTAWRDNGTPLTLRHGSENGPSMVGDGGGGLLCVWADDAIGSDTEIVVQRIERHGHWGYPAPFVELVQDVPGDQGGKALLSWWASRLDPWPQEEITQYSLWRALPPLEGKAAPVVTDDWAEKIIAGPGTETLIRLDSGGDKNLFWELVGTQQAFQMPSYGATVPTYHDSTGTDPAHHMFQVAAHGAFGNMCWFSPPVVGWSVDNLAPGIPANLAGQGQYAPTGLRLTWSPNSETDLDHYVVHRGAAPGFTPTEANRIAAPTDTVAFDAGWDLDGTWYYKVAAVDVHENTGGFALLTPPDVSGAGASDLPRTTALVGNHPNPFNPATTIRYTVAPDGADVELAIYDLRGHKVKVLVQGPAAGGNREVTWNGTAADGRSLPSGTYFCRLSSGEIREVLKITLMK